MASRPRARFACSVRRSRTRRSARRSCSQLFGGGGGDDNNDSDEGAGDDDLDGGGVGDDGVNETLDAGVLDDGIEGWLAAFRARCSSSRRSARSCSRQGAPRPCKRDLDDPDRRRSDGRLGAMAFGVELRCFIWLDSRSFVRSPSFACLVVARAAHRKVLWDRVPPDHAVRRRCDRDRRRCRGRAKAAASFAGTQDKSREAAWRRAAHAATPTLTTAKARTTLPLRTRPAAGTARRSAQPRPFLR